MLANLAGLLSVELLAGWELVVVIVVRLLGLGVVVVVELGEVDLTVVTSSERRLISLSFCSPAFSM